jgi:hypothetical protein
MMAVNYDRSEILQLVQQAKNATPEQLKELSQSDRKTLQIILDIFKSNPDITTAKVEGQKYQSLEARLTGRVFPFRRESWITRIFKKLTGSYIHTASIRQEIENTLNNLYQYKETSGGGINTDQALKNAAYNYKGVYLQKLRDNLDNLPNHALLQKARAMLNGEIIPKLRMHGLSEDVRYHLNSAKTEFEKFIAELEAKEVPTATVELTERKITINPIVKKHVTFEEVVIPESPKDPSVEEKSLSDRVKQGDPTVDKFQKENQIVAENLKQGNVIAVVLGMEYMRNEYAHRYPEGSQQIALRQKQLLDALYNTINTMKEEGSIDQRDEEMLHRILDVLSNSDIPKENRIYIAKKLHQHPVGMQLQEEIRRLIAANKNQVIEPIENLKQPDNSLEKDVAQIRILAPLDSGAREAPKSLQPMGINRENIQIPVNPQNDPMCERNILQLKTLARLFEERTHYNPPKTISYDKEKREFFLTESSKKSTNSPESFKALEEMIQTCRFAVSDVSRKGIPPEMVKSILTSLEKDDWAKATISNNEVLQTTLRKVNKELIVETSKYEERKDKLYIDQVVAPIEGPQMDALLSIPFSNEATRAIQTMFEGQAQVLMAEKGILTPSQILYAYKDAISSDELFVAIQEALTNDNVSAEQKNVIVEFIQSWLESGFYEEDLNRPEIQKAIQSIIQIPQLKKETIAISETYESKIRYLNRRNVNRQENAPKGQRYIDFQFFKPILSGKLSLNKYHAAIDNFAKNIISYRLPIFESIPMKERFEGNTRKTTGGGKLKTPHARAAVEANDNISMRIGEDVLTVKRPKARGNLVKFYTTVAFRLQSIGDFDGAGTILAGIANPEVERIIRDPKLTKLSKETISQLDELKEIHSPLNNYQNLKEEEKKLKQKGIIPLIPFSITLADITMADQQPPFIEDSKGKGWNPSRIGKMHKALENHFSGLRYMLSAGIGKPELSLNVGSYIKSPMTIDQMGALSDQIKPRKEIAE